MTIVAKKNIHFTNTLRVRAQFEGFIGAVQAEHGDDLEIEIKVKAKSVLRRGLSQQLTQKEEQQ